MVRSDFICLWYVCYETRCRAAALSMFAEELHLESWHLHATEFVNSRGELLASPKLRLLLATASVLVAGWPSTTIVLEAAIYVGTYGKYG